MQCPNCGFEIPQDMKFCGMCAQKVAKECLHCGLLSPLEYRFCGHCGNAFASDPESTQVFSRLPANISISEKTDGENGVSSHLPLQTPTKILSGERRLATVLIADVVKSTRILEQIGSEDWVELMNRMLQVMSSAIYRFGGVVDQFRGDGLVAFFGARHAHEDDPERAVMAALAMQVDIQKQAQSLKKEHGIDFFIRIGINTGEVITANIGVMNQHSEDTTMGGAVTLAARLEAAAEPGTILVSESTYRLVENRFNWKPIG